MRDLVGDGRIPLQNFWRGFIHFFNLGTAACQSKTKNSMANSVDPDEMAHMSPLICIYTICVSICLGLITKTGLLKYIENFTTKNWKFSGKNSDIFHTSAQNIDCGYSLEMPHRGISNEYHNLCFWAEIRKRMYTHVNTSFIIWKRSLRGSK